MPTYKEQQILDKVCKVTRQKQIKYYDFIPFLDFQYEKIIFNCQPSHFSPCSVVPELISGCRGSGFERSVESITNYQDYFVELLIQLVREILQLLGKSQGNPETSGCSNHIKFPLWSTLLFCMA